MEFDDRMPDKVKTSMTAIMEMNDQLRPRISKSQFVKEFLPLLTSDQETDIQPWLNIARHVVNEVDVIDDDGTVVWTVPPLLAPSKTRTGGDTVQSIAANMLIASKRSEIHPNLGDKHIVDTVHAVGGHRIDSIKYIKMWNKILADNDMPVIEIVGDETGDESDDNPINLDSTTLVYEDL